MKYKKIHKKRDWEEIWQNDKYDIEILTLIIQFINKNIKNPREKNEQKTQITNISK